MSGSDSPVPLSVATHDRGDRFRRDDAWLASAHCDADSTVLLVDDAGGIAATVGGLTLGGPDALDGVAVPTLLAVTGETSAVFAATPSGQSPADPWVPRPGGPGSTGLDGAGQDPVVPRPDGPTSSGLDGAGRGGAGSAPVSAGPPDTAEPGSALTPFRDVLEHLDPAEAALAVQAIALARWQADHRFCGRCGTATTLTTAGHRRLCPGCGARNFPRTDPVATMLVTDGRDRALLSRRRGAKEKVWSCLAGFVEPGETPEQAVVRETMEEVGLRVLRVESIGSQPWPQPYELMIGHRAVVLPREPVVAAELADARWWDREELRAALAADEARLPPPYTIGNHAISVWLTEV